MVHYWIISVTYGIIRGHIVLIVRWLPALAHVNLSALILARLPAVSPWWRVRAAGGAKNGGTLKDLRQPIFLLLFLGFSYSVCEGRVVCRYGSSHGNSTGEGERVLALVDIQTETQNCVINPNRDRCSRFRPDNSAFRSKPGNLPSVHLLSVFTILMSWNPAGKSQHMQFSIPTTSILKFQIKTSIHSQFEPVFPNPSMDKDKNPSAEVWSVNICHFLIVIITSAYLCVCVCKIACYIIRQGHPKQEFSGEQAQCKWKEENKTHRR